MMLLLLFCAAPPLDPLPPGAIARLGDARFGTNFGVTGLAFLSGGAQLAIGDSAASPVVHDARTGRCGR